jgi:trans-aconitate methyltransferase
MQFADEHPTATVLGVDLSPIQLTQVPPNCSFRVDNIEADWVPEEKYDFIHSRAMIGGFKNWSRFIEQAFE